MRAVQSVLKQSLKPQEIVIVDDASPVPPPDFSDTRIRVLQNESNSGPGISRNRGMEVANGDCIAFLDSDDYWHTDYLKMAVRALDSQPQAAMAYANGYEVDAKEKIKDWRRGKIKHLNTILPHVLRTNRHWGTSGCLWRKSAIEDVRWIDTKTWEDYAFDIDVAVKNNAVVSLPGTLVYYDISGNDKLSDKPGLKQEKIRALTHIIKTLSDSEQQKDKTLKKSLNYLLYLHGYKTFDSKKKNDPHRNTWLSCYGDWNGKIKSSVMRRILKLPFGGEKFFLRVGIYRNKRLKNG